MGTGQDYEPLTTSEMIEDLDRKKLESETIIAQMARQGMMTSPVFMLPAESETVTELLEALVQASKEFQPVKQSAVSTVPYRYKYATLDDLVSATEGGLANHNLRIIHQELPLDRDCWIMVTKLWHSKSGEWIASYAPIDPDPQAGGGFSSKQEWGKQCTYIRKYQMADLLNLTADSDSDGSDTRSEAATPGSGKQAAAQGAAQGKRKQSPPEKKTWVMLNKLGIDQSAWKADLCKRYRVDSCTKLDAATWLKIATSLDKYVEMIGVICEHWQAKASEVQAFLVYKHRHKISEAYEVMHEALNSENGKMAELFSAFCEWKEMPEGEPESEDAEVEMDAIDGDLPGVEKNQPKRHNPPK